MIVRELIKRFKEQWIDVTALLPLDRKVEVTRKVLTDAGVTPDVLLKYDSMPLWSVRGIGPVKAAELWAKGVRPGNLARHKALLPEATILALKYKPLDRIAHDLVTKIAADFIPADEKTKITIVGSYRRERPTSGDIDLLFVTDEKDGLQLLINKLQTTHLDKWILFAKGVSKLAGLYRYAPKVWVEVDLWIASKANQHAMLLYSTGSKLFNVRMRFIAKHRGLKLNQYGVWKNDKLVKTKSERDIFDMLKMEYKKPEERE